MSEKKLPIIPSHIKGTISTTDRGEMIITIPAWQSHAHGFHPTPEIRSRVLSAVSTMSRSAIKLLQKVDSFSRGERTVVHAPETHPITPADIAMEHRIDEMVQESKLSQLVSTPEGRNQLQDYLRHYDTWVKKHPEVIAEVNQRSASILGSVSKNLDAREWMHTLTKTQPREETVKDKPTSSSRRQPHSRDRSRCDDEPSL